MLNDKRKKITVSKNAKCDYCNKPMKFMGSNDINTKIYKACPEHKDQAQADLKAERDENN